MCVERHDTLTSQKSKECCAADISGVPHDDEADGNGVVLSHLKIQYGDHVQVGADDAKFGATRHPPST